MDTFGRSKASNMNMAQEERAPLDDATLDFLETQIPAQAFAATQAAYWNTLTRGYSVVCARGNELCEVFPNGSVRVIKQLKPNVVLPVDIDFTL